MEMVQYLAVTCLGLFHWKRGFLDRNEMVRMIHWWGSYFPSVNIVLPESVFVAWFENLLSWNASIYLTSRWRKQLKWQFILSAFDGSCCSSPKPGLLLFWLLLHSTTILGFLFIVELNNCFFPLDCFVGGGGAVHLQSPLPRQGDTLEIFISDVPCKNGNIFPFVWLYLSS